jgi:hypothetical protein
MTAPSKLLRIPFLTRTDWCMPASVTVLGVVGLLDDSWLRHDPAALATLHALLGLALCALLIARFSARMRALASPQACDIRALSRHLSRTVYLLLGILVVFKELAGSGGEDLRDYLVCCLAALVLIRLLALGYWLKIKPSKPGR